ncbi:MAG TPA: cytochrome c maturation protein CcmE [Methylovirgula sp.]|nr:cytochrome c maturation protein CcmE [Methylovirgula sp.]
MTRKRKRLALILSALVVLGSGLGLVLYALRDNIVFFYGPSEVLAKELAPGTRLRIGGLVKPGSLTHDGMTVHFAVTDGKRDIPVTYSGPLPDLFREGQGVVAEGVLGVSGMTASTILAKHDERYMPREVVDALKKAGRWQESTGKSAGIGGGS